MTESRKLAAILAADVAGFSRFTGADEEGTLKRLRDLRRELIDPAIATNRGRIVKTTGDGILIEFASVVDAARCAIAVQRGMATRNDDFAPEKRIEFRVGIHLGDVVVEEDGDLMGDGVNIAARLEGIAEPGGICLSNAAYEQVRDRVKEQFVDLGERDLKNIARPVRVFAIDTRTHSVTPAKAGVHASAAETGAGMGPGFRRGGDTLEWAERGKIDNARSGPPRFSIVVLPFTNIGGDPEQEYFVDGVTESLTTDLSRISGSFVIARNTAFTYKGKSVDVKQIGRDLNIRYVLEGSVQRGGNRMRVNVQLIDAETGNHLWAERFDKPVADLFDMQDEIVARLANTLGHELVRAEARRSERLSNPDSVDLTMRGWAILNQPTMLGDMNVVGKALGLFEQALNLDPDNVDALVVAAATDRFNHVNAGKQSTPEQIARIEERLAKAIRIDPSNARAYTVRGMLYVVTKRTREALQAARNAVNLNPNYASAYAQLAQNQMAPEEWSQSIANIDQAIKLSPRDPELGRWHWIKGKTLLYMSEYPDAIREGHAAIDNGWAIWSAYLVLAAGYALSGQQKEAEDFAARILDANPSFTIKYLRSRVEDPEVMFEDLRQAGLPEG
jgi:adenylate cyclase